MKYSKALAATVAILTVASCANQTQEAARPTAVSSAPSSAERTVSLVRVGGAHAPVSDASPSKQSSSSAAGWREQDAQLAAAWFAVVVDGAQEPPVRAAALEQVVPAQARDAAEARLQVGADIVAAGRAAEDSDGPSPEAWIPDMRVVGYVDEAQSGQDRTVSVWGRSDGTSGQWWNRTITVRWTGTDWAWVADPWPGEWAEGTPPDDLTPYLSSEGADDE